MEFDKNYVEETSNYKILKNQLEEALRKVSQTSDLREAKSYLIDIQDEFKGLKLLRDDREELYKRLQDSFAEINQKIEDERSLFNHEALQNYSDIKLKVEEALFLASNPKDFNETWDFLLEVQSMFKRAKLLHEHRDSMYAVLQEAFKRIKKFRETEQNNLEKEITQNYIQINETIKQAIDKSSQSIDFREAKNELIRAQTEFRNARLTKEKRDELNSKLQDAFTLLNIRMEDSIAKKRMEAEKQYNEFNSRALDILSGANESNEFNQIRKDIKQIQAEIRDSSLLNEHRENLRTILQKAFEIVNQRQDNERNTFDQEAQMNYNRLKSMVNNGLDQAEKSNEYKETREYLKKIQSEFKGIKLKKEQREELYSRLQSAFEILNIRVDEYFREKKKNWELRMQYKLSSLSTDIFSLSEMVSNDTEKLKEMEEFLQNITTPAINETSAVLGLKARISSMRITIVRKQKQIQDWEAEMAELKLQLTPNDLQEQANY